MKRRYLLGVTTTAAIVGALAVVTIAAAQPEAPIRLEPTILSQPASGFEGNIALSPVPNGYQPAILADTANATALAHFPDLAIVSVEPQLALLSWNAQPVDEFDDPSGPPLYTGVPVWLVSVKGACSQWLTSTGECVNDTTNLVIDAKTGEFIIGYAP